MKSLGTGATGVEVAKLQEDLNLLANEQLSITAILDTPTSSALERYQQRHHLPVSGIADLSTQVLLSQQRKLHQYQHPVDFKRQYLTLIAPVNTVSNYGNISCQLLSDWRSANFQVRIRRKINSYVEASIPEFIHELQVPDGPQPDLWELVMGSPDQVVTPGRRVVFFTMWDLAGLPKVYVDKFNKCDAIVVPSHWHLSSFSAAGVKSPIYVAQPGVNITELPHIPISMHGMCIFGAGGRLHGDGCRKRLEDVIWCFQQAFPKEQDAQLHLKLAPGETIQTFD